MKEELKSFGFGTTLEQVLVKRRFTINTFQPHDPTFFGNAMLELSNSEIRLRLVRDRDDEFIDLGPRFGNEWFGMRHIARLVDPSLLLNDNIRLRIGTEEALVRLLDADWTSTARLFEDQNMARTRVLIDAFKEADRVEFLRGREKEHL